MAKAINFDLKVRDVGSLGLGLTTGIDGNAPLLESQVGGAVRVDVLEDLRWSILLREGKRWPTRV